MHTTSAAIPRPDLTDKPEIDKSEKPVAGIKYRVLGSNVVFDTRTEALVYAAYQPKPGWIHQENSNTGVTWAFIVK